MIIHLSRELYPKIVVLKAAYQFTDRCYILLDQNETEYSIRIEAKLGDNPLSEKEFNNELLAQLLRFEINKETSDLRKLIIARAMASTIVGKIPEVKQDNILSSNEDEVLKDWFEDNDDKKA